MAGDKRSQQRIKDLANDLLESNTEPQNSANEANSHTSSYSDNSVSSTSRLTIVLIVFGTCFITYLIALAANLFPTFFQVLGGVCQAAIGAFGAIIAAVITNFVLLHWDE